jgi:hypothetical protein
MDMGVKSSTPLVRANEYTNHSAQDLIKKNNPLEIMCDTFRPTTRFAQHWNTQEVIIKNGQFCLPSFRNTIASQV